MKNNFTITSRISLLAMLLFFSMNLFAQPANDNCADATPLVLSADQGSCLRRATPAWRCAAPDGRPPHAPHPSGSGPA